MSALFDLQGHRGARGLKPENTLPAFEVALDLGVTSLETDVHLTRDGVPVLCHDSAVSDQLCRLVAGSSSPSPSHLPAVRTLSLEEMRGYRADQNPDPERFPDQDACETPLARLFAGRRGQDPYGPPSLADLLAFVEAYGGDLGAAAGKTEGQRGRARHVRFDLELKRVPFRPDIIGDAFDGETPGLLEERVVQILDQAGVAPRTTVRSFDHRCVRVLRRLDPRLRGAVIIAGTAPVAPAQLARQADAQVYSPDFEFLDESQVRQLHAEGVRVVPWTVNEPESWNRLIEWGVDGITTDFPDGLAKLLRGRGVAF